MRVRSLANVRQPHAMAAAVEAAGVGAGTVAAMSEEDLKPIVRAVRRHVDAGRGPLGQGARLVLCRCSAADSSPSTPPPTFQKRHLRAAPTQRSLTPSSWKCLLELCARAWTAPPCSAC